MYQYETRGLFDTNPAAAWAIIIIASALIILTLAGLWKVFQKAGKPGWAAIVPIYNVIVLVQISGRPGWWAAVMLLAGLVPVVGPFAQLGASIYVNMGLAEKFGKSQGFGVGMALLGFIFYPMLGFGDAEYEGGAGKTNDEILDAI